jgi:hypothetical protein
MDIHIAVLMAMQRVEVITDGARRRRCAEEEKLRLVRGAFLPGARVAEFAHAEGVDASLLCRWRRQRLGETVARPSFAPQVVMRDDGPEEGGLDGILARTRDRGGGARLRRAGAAGGWGD